MLTDGGVKMLARALERQHSGGVSVVSFARTAPSRLDRETLGGPVVRPGAGLCRSLPTRRRSTYWRTARAAAAPSPSWRRTASWQGEHHHITSNPGIGDFMCDIGDNGRVDHVLPTIFAGPALQWGEPGTVCMSQGRWRQRGAA